MLIMHIGFFACFHAISLSKAIVSAKLPCYYPSARMRSEGYSSRSVCLSVCLFVCLFVSIYSRTTGYEAAYERYQQLQCYKGRKNNVAILLKRLRSRDMA